MAIEFSAIGGYSEVGMNMCAFKIGEEAIINEFILEPVKHLNPRGEFWFVVVSKLNQLIKRVGKQNKLHFKKISKRRGHTVYKFILI